MSPPRPEPVTLAGAAGSLQAVIEDPCEPGVPPAAYAVVCHPHPLHGGTMDNKVATTVARSCHELGVPTIRFNFRGVGASEGSFDEGVGETNDALTAVAFGRERWPGAALWLAGFSVQGDADEVIAPQEVIGWAQALQPRPYLVVMPGVGHFFHGRLNELRAALLGWVRSG